LQGIRYAFDLRLTAGIIMTIFIGVGLITENELLIFTVKSKGSQRKLWYLWSKNLTKFVRSVKLNAFVYGREDTTKIVLEAHNSDQRFPGIINEQNFTLCSEADGRHLCHITPEEHLLERKSS